MPFVVCSRLARPIAFATLLAVVAAVSTEARAFDKPGQAASSATTKSKDRRFLGSLWSFSGKKKDNSGRVALRNSRDDAPPRSIVAPAQPATLPKVQQTQSKVAKSQPAKAKPVETRKPSMTERQLMQNLRSLNRSRQTESKVADVSQEPKPEPNKEVVTASFDVVENSDANTATPLLPVAEPVTAVPDVPANPVEVAAPFIEVESVLPKSLPATPDSRLLPIAVEGRGEANAAKDLADSLVPRQSSAGRVFLDDVETADVVEPPMIANPSKQHAPIPAPSDPSFGHGYRYRVSHVLDRDRLDPLREYWHQQSVAWNRRNRKVSDHFVQFYDPELQESYNTDDYHMPVVVASASASQQPRTNDSQRSDLLSRKITDIKPSLGYAWRDIDKSLLPKDFDERMDHGVYERNQPPLTVMQWAPTNFWHHPLYFEDPTLERYGHTYHPVVQPFASTGRFFGQLVGLPYQMTLHPMHAREYTLGWYRPGEWAPKKTYQVPFNQEAATIQTLTMVGLFFLIP